MLELDSSSIEEEQLAGVSIASFSLKITFELEVLPLSERLLLDEAVSSFSQPRSTHSLSSQR